MNTRSESLEGGTPEGMLLSSRSIRALNRGQGSTLYEYKVKRRRLVAQEQSEIYSQVLSTASAVAAMHRKVLGDSDHRETVIAYYVDTQNRVTGYEVVAVGNCNQVAVDMREVFRGALLAGATALIIAHNHPSGVALPSVADDALTERAIAAGKLIGLEVLDHVVVARSDYHSYRMVTPEIFA